MSNNNGQPSSKEIVADLRLRLVNAQFALQQSDFSVILLLAGSDRAGCEQIVDRLHEWMDFRYLDIWFGGPPTEEERSRPRAWRYWRAMPARGRIGIYLGGWMTGTIVPRVRGELSKKEYKRRVRHSVALDKLLSANGTLMLKLWVDVPRKVMKGRLKQAEADADIAMYVEDLDWQIFEYIDKAKPIIDETLSDTGKILPWTVIDGSDEKSRDLKVANSLLNAIESRLTGGSETVPHWETTDAEPEIPAHLAGVDLQASLPYSEYRQRLDELQIELHELSLQCRKKKLASVLVMEGWDAAGKGGVIRRLTQAISARDCKVFPISAPTDEELAHHYLWRFWRRVPRDSQMAIFDRSWYGRVLVERVEALATEDEWRRAYEEINDFESQLLEHGTPVIKFWLHISPDEQMSRFRARENTPYKKYKISADDYRNRSKWPAYTDAVNEMVERTGTGDAPWHLVPANNKRWARVQVLETVNNTLKKFL